MNESPKRSVFVLRDFLDDKIEGVLTQLQKTGAGDCQVEVPGLGQDLSQGAVFDDLVRPKLEEADQILVLANTNNINVAFELGYVLGFNHVKLDGERPRVKLVTTLAKGQRIEWLDRGPFPSYEAPRATKPADFREVISNERALSVPPFELETGSGVLFLASTDGDGAAYREHVQKFDWKTLPDHDWYFAKLAEHLGDIDKLVWVITPHLEGEDQRDGAENCVNAAIAGFAAGAGLELEVFVASKFRRVADVAHLGRRYADPPTLCRWLDEIRSAASGPADDSTISRYAAFLRQRHNDLVPFFSHLAERTLDEVYVELSIGTDSSERDRDEREPRADFSSAFADDVRRRPWTLETLLAVPTGAKVGGGRASTGRFVIQGEPGAGKSTICRHLCFRLAGGGTGSSDSPPSGFHEDATKPIPLFIPLAAWAGSGKDPFEWVQEEMRSSLGLEAAEGLADHLRAEAQKEGRVWIIFDGLDEVAQERIEQARTALNDLAGSSVGTCRIVVTTRPAGYRPLGKAFLGADLQPLTIEGRRQLLDKWIPGRAERLLENLSPALEAISFNPLMLTLIAALFREKKARDLPRTRGQLYEKAIRLLLERGHRPSMSALPAPSEALRVRRPESALQVLIRLALELHRDEKESWSSSEVLQVLVEQVEPHVGGYLKPWDSSEAFLQEVSQKSGVLTPSTGGDAWVFLHRSLREYLAAKGLEREGRKRYLALAKTLTEDEQARHWGEVFALLCGLVEPADRLPLLEALKKASPGLALRALPQVEELDPARSLAFLRTIGGWDGDDLTLLAKGWRSQGKSEKEVEELLWSQVRPRPMEELAFPYYALEQLGLPVDRERFFRRCNRWPKGGPPELECVRVPPDGASFKFQMGSPPGEGYDHERPQHPVTISAFHLGVTPVTESQYAKFDSDQSVESPNHPVVDVSWWQAWLFCRWVGGRLPTEAEWEGACRAGTETRWYTGNDERDLEKAAWYIDNSKKSTQPVGLKQPNAWRLHDMHGNVWEWCADGYELYGEEHQADPAVPLRGDFSVVRGGSFPWVAEMLRSACRGWWTRTFLYDDIGFRVAWPAPARSSSLDD